MHPKKRTPRNRRSRRNRPTNSISDPGPEPFGDIPREPKRTYTTVSVPRPVVGGNYCYRQIIDGAQLQANPTGFGFAYSWTIGALDAITSLGSVFDQYRISAVDFHIVPDQNALQVATLTTTQFIPLYVVIDYDDSTTPTSAAYCRQYNNCIELAPGESLHRRFRPRYELASVVGGTATNVANIGNEWLDVAVTTLVHRGIKVWAPSTVAAQVLLQTWTVYVELFVEFRSVR